MERPGTGDPLLAALPLRLENPPSWLTLEDGGGGLGFAPLLVAAGEFLLPAFLVAGAVVGGGLIFKDAFGLNPSRIPLAAILGGAGAISFVVSGYTEGAWRPALIALGVIGSVGSLVYLFGSAGEETPPVVTPSPRVPAVEQVPQLPAHDLRDMIDIQIDPSQPNTGGYYRQVGFPQAFETVLRNKSQQTLSFFVGTQVWRGADLLWETPNEPGATQGCSDWFPSNFGRQKITLKPGEEKVVCVAAPASTVFIPSIVGVKFVFYREGDDLTSFLSSTGLLQIAWGLG